MELMGAGYLPVIAQGWHTASDLGYSVGNVGGFNTVILTECEDGSYLAHVDVCGGHNTTGGSSTDFEWLNLSKIWTKAMELTGTNKAAVLGHIIPFYHQNVISDVAYSPVLIVNETATTLQVGRIYGLNGEVGAWPMSSLHAGTYSFGVYLKLWKE